MDVDIVCVVAYGGQECVVVSYGHILEYLKTCAAIQSDAMTLVADFFIYGTTPKARLVLRRNE